MVMWVSFDVVGGYDKERTPLFNCEDTINWYIIQNPNGKKSQALSRVPGYKFELHLESANGYSRPNGLFSFENNLYSVVGDSVYLIESDLNVIDIGSLSTSDGYMSISANNSQQIIFVDGTDGFICDTFAQTFTQITDPAFPPNPQMVAFLDGYFVTIAGGTNTFVLSAPNDGTKWTFAGNAEYATANAYPGILTALAVVNRRLFLFKEQSTEVWYNAGASDFPFRRDNNSILSYGCATKNSIATGEGLLFFMSLGENGNYSIMSSDGSNPKKISTSSIDDTINAFTNPLDMDSIIYKTEDGHLFYQMNWTTDDFTLVYDVTTNLWHRMKLISKKPKEEFPFLEKTRHIANSHAFAFGKHFIGSYKDQNLYSLSLNYSNNNGEPIVCSRTFKHLIQSNYRAIQIDDLQLDFQSGVGNVSGIYRDPAAYLEISRNGGISFGNEMRSQIGRLGHREQRTIWHQLGQYYDFVGRVNVYADVSPLYLLGGAINYIGIER